MAHCPVSVSDVAALVVAKLCRFTQNRRIDDTTQASHSGVKDNFMLLLEKD